MKKIAIRDAYGDALKSLGAENERVVALEADVGGSTKSAVFGKEFPNRYFQVGISELNMLVWHVQGSFRLSTPFRRSFRHVHPIQFFRWLATII